MDPSPSPTAVAAVRALARVSRVLERASGDLTLSHYRVLAGIDSGEERASRIAAWLAVGKPTISSTVDSLCRRGLVERADSADDQRAATLSLTPAGRTLLEQVELDMVTRLQLLADASPDGPRLVESLGWLGSAIDETRAARAELSARPAEPARSAGPRSTAAQTTDPRSTDR